jgi:hypothetical protein
MNTHQLSQIILNITIFSVFIGFFFFTYAASVEKDIVKDQSSYIATDIATDLRVFLPSSVRMSIIDNLKVPDDMTEKDATVKEANNKLMKEAMIALSILLVVGILSTMVVAYIGGIGIHIVKDSFVILIFVAVTEIVFLNLITRQYRVSDPNYVKKEMLLSLKKAFPPVVTQ